MTAGGRTGRGELKRAACGVSPSCRRLRGASSAPQLSRAGAFYPLTTCEDCRRAVNPRDFQPASRSMQAKPAPAAQGQAFEKKKKEQQVLTVRSKSTPKGSPRNAETALRGSAAAPSPASPAPAPPRTRLAEQAADELGKQERDEPAASDAFEHRRHGVSARKGAGAFPEFRGCCFPSLELSCLCLGSRFQTKSV